MAEKERGALLTIWLILMLLANSATALSYFLLNAAIAAAYPNVPPSIFYVYGLMALANAAFTALLFMWKKYAFFAFCISSGIAFALNIAIGVGAGTVLGLMGPVILYALLRPKWSLLE